MFPHRVLLGGVIVALAGGLSLVAVMRSSPKRSETERSRAELAGDLVTRGQREFRRVKIEKFASLRERAKGDRERLAAMIAGLVERREAEFGGGGEGAGPGEARERALHAEVGAFIATNFVLHDGAAYLEWSASRGRLLIPIDEMKRTWSIGQFHEWFFGEPLPEAIVGDDPTWTFERALFQKFWDHASKGRRPVGMASEGKGIVISYGDFSALDQGARTFRGGSIGHDLWIGAVGASTIPFFQPKGSKEGRLPPRLERTACADVACLYEFDDGSRRPIILLFLWDPEIENWVLHRVNIHNYPLENYGFIAS